MVKGLLRAGLPNGIAALLVLINEHGQEFSELLFLGGSVIELVKTQKLAGQAFAFLIRADNVRQCPPQQLPVCFLVEIDGRRAHCFQSPRSYSACVKIYKTKTRCVW